MREPNPNESASRGIVSELEGISLEAQDPVEIFIRMSSSLFVLDSSAGYPNGRGQKASITMPMTCLNH